MRKRKRNRKAVTEIDDARIEASVAEGGLVVYERDGAMLHVAPPMSRTP